MFVKYATSDNAFGKFGSAVNTTQTTITLSFSQNLPTGTAVWIATLTQYAIDGTVGKFEKVKVTNNVSGTLTVVRGFDGTTAETFNQDDYVFLNVVSEIIKDIQEQAENPVKWEFKNQSGSTIPVFRVVQATGALGASGKMTAAPFLADGSVSQIYALGISRTAVSNGSDGEALAFGKIHGIDTTGSVFSETWSEGDVLYCSPTVAGGLTKVKPGATYLVIPIAMIINVHAINGTIAVRVPDTYKLGELHDVSFTSITTGDSIFRHASGYWYNAQAYTKAQIDAKINAVNGIAGLNGSGQLDPSVLPVLATTESVIVADQTAMLALTSGQIQKGDIAVQLGGSNAGTRWLFGGGTISDINNWILLADTTPEWAVIAGKPTTISGYGITDAVTIAGVQTITGGKIFTGGITTTDLNNKNVMYFLNSSGTLKRHISHYADFHLTESAVADYRFIVKAGGKIGVGVDPTSRFHVAHNDGSVTATFTGGGGGWGTEGVLFVKSESSGSGGLTRYVARFANSSSDILVISNDSKMNLTGQIVQTFSGEAVRIIGGASQSWMGFYNGETREGYIGTYAGGVGLTVNSDVGTLVFGSSPVYNLGGFDFNGGRIKKLYQTATGGGGGTLYIGSRYELSNIQYSSLGHILQILWGDTVGSPEGSGNDGGWGLEFGSHGRPYLKMINNETQVSNLRINRTIDNSTINLNDVTTGGFFSGYDLVNAPTTDWYFCEIMVHSIEGGGVGYIMQRITRMTGSGYGVVFVRVKSITTWSSWVQL